MIDIYAYDEYLRGVNRGIIKGQQSCAASPWHYRDSNGDGTGKVVESAELPEMTISKEKLGYFPTADELLEYGTFLYDFLMKNWYVNGELVTEDWLRKHLIAWAVIQGGE